MASLLTIRKVFCIASDRSVDGRIPKLHALNSNCDTSSEGLPVLGTVHLVVAAPGGRNQPTRRCQKETAVGLGGSTVL